MQINDQDVALHPVIGKLKLRADDSWVESRAVELSAHGLGQLKPSMRYFNRARCRHAAGNFPNVHGRECFEPCQRVISCLPAVGWVLLEAPENKIVEAFGD